LSLLLIFMAFDFPYFFILTTNSTLAN
jgi:hypothetical protein